MSTPQVTPELANDLARGCSGWSNVLARVIDHEGDLIAERSRDDLAACCRALKELGAASSAAAESMRG